MPRKAKKKVVKDQPKNDVVVYELPKVSIVVAAYNVEKYLPKCLDSISLQTYQDIEIIVIDDGSKDMTGKLCDIYGKKESRAKIIHQENQGLSAVRNRGIEEATGEYIAFIDGDDYLDIQFVESMMEDLLPNYGDIAVCGFVALPNGSAEIPNDEVLSGEEATIRLLTEQDNYQIIACNKIYRRSLFTDVRYPVGKKHEDNLTTYKLFALSEKVVFVSDVLYNYIQREDSIMGSGDLDERLKAKMIAAKDAKKLFHKNADLHDAAKIAELLAHYQYIDNIIAKRSKTSSKEHFEWIKKNRKELKKNPFINKKLKVYMRMSTCLGGIFYKIFRKIKN